MTAEACCSAVKPWVARGGAWGIGRLELLVLSAEGLSASVGIGRLERLERLERLKRLQQRKPFGHSRR